MTAALLLRLESALRRLPADSSAASHARGQRFMGQPASRELRSDADSGWDALLATRVGRERPIADAERVRSGAPNSGPRRGRRWRHTAICYLRPPTRMAGGTPLRPRRF